MGLGRPAPGIDSTLNIVSNEVKYKADVIKEYGDIPDIQCLPLQINQVVMNLVVNAAHAIGEQRGRITVGTGSDGDDWVWIDVADNGSGIAPETLSRIFDPFFTTKAVGKGTGLGLSLAYGIVQKHGGRIEVDTEPGQGHPLPRAAAGAPCDAATGRRHEYRPAAGAGHRGHHAAVRG
jgi:two-component system NtrC family sensor kinase